MLAAALVPVYTYTSMKTQILQRWPQVMLVWRRLDNPESWVVATRVVNRIGVWQHYVRIDVRGRMLTGEEERMKLVDFQALYSAHRIQVRYVRKAPGVDNHFASASPARTDENGCWRTLGE